LGVLKGRRGGGEPKKSKKCYNLGMITKEFKQAYQRLNQAQKEAVDNPTDGPIMVIAGPGTGKTQILTLRIAKILIDTDTPASGILALTFTEAGQKAMKLKLRQLIGSRADEVGIFTYHGFAASVIAEFTDHFPQLARVRQMSEVEAETLVREILRDKKFSKLRPLGEPDLYLNKIIKTISDCRKEAWDPEFIRQYARDEIERIKADPASKSTRGATKGLLKAEAEKQIEKVKRTIVFADVYDQYEINKKEQKKIDFDDLIFELIKAFEADDLLLRLLQEKYLYILVDEHQDTNNSQNVLIKKLASFEENPNLFVVGDEKQAIYRFQGASVKNFLEFQDIWPKMKVIKLTDNYRSPQDILSATFKMIENNYGADEHHDLRIQLKAVSEEKPEPVAVVSAGNNEAVEEYLTEKVKKIVESDEDKTVAVIVRTNREVERILEVLETAGVSASAERGTDVFSHPVGVIYFKLLEFLSDESRLEALGYTLAGGLWDLGLDKSAELLRRIRGGQNLELEKNLPKLVGLKKIISKTGPIEFLIVAAEDSGLKRLVAGEPLSAEVWQSIINLAQDLALSKNIDDPRLLITELLNYRQMAEKRNIKISAGVTDAQVSIMTAHGSKGLEYDYVFLPYATEESWMSKGRGHYFVLPEKKDEADEIRDARRLFYVALTRAKKHVSILVSLADALDRPFSPLRFIDELDGEHVSRVEIPASKTSLVSARTRSPKERDELESLEYAKHVLLEKGLSVTALNHFVKCPNKFFYKSILKLPEAPTASSEKGNAMHEALSAVWALPKKDQSSITETITKVTGDYFRHSLLPVYEKEVIIEELGVNAPKVAEALLDHFTQKGTISSEKWEESNFTGQFAGQTIELRLHGKLDAIVVTPKQVLVYDYKTKESMSEREIKGETKSSDGSYFRQLIFYKILLNENYLYQGKNILPALVFVKPDNKGRCPTVSLSIEKKDLERVKAEIQALINSVWSGQLLFTACDDPKCEFCALRGMMK